MSKHHRRGRATFKYAIRLEQLLLHVLHDVGRHTDVTTLYRSFDREGVLGVYNHVTEELALASLHESNIVRYICLRQVHALLHKNADLPGSSKKMRQETALSTFRASERKCSRTNRRLAFYRTHWSRAPVAVTILNDAASLIRQALPDVLDVYDRILDSATFGPGVTFASQSYEERALCFKISSLQTLTESARGVFLDYARRNPRWLTQFPEIQVDYVRGDRVTFVPKSSKTDRTIAIQPSLNLFLQKGVESILVDVLRRIGVTLTVQERNGEAAARGSVYGDLSTVDLSSASDSVSIELVRWLLPEDWFNLLDALRTHEFTLDRGQTWCTSNKFSSMGNAFTFPLESLIFWAILRAVMNHVGDNGEWRVYGDDIVVPVTCYALLGEVLSFAGFSLNRDKSFCFGSFRESCGYDFVRGVPVRPVYLGRVPRHIEDVYNLYNRLLLNETRLPLPGLMRYLRESVDRPHVGPIHQPLATLGHWDPGFNPMLDSYFISDPPEGEPEWCEDHQHAVWTVKVLQRRYKEMDQLSGVIRYNLFLLGVGVDRVDDLSRPLVVQTPKKFRDWPYLRDWLSNVNGQDARDSRRNRMFVPVAELHRLARNKFSAKLLTQ